MPAISTDNGGKATTDFGTTRRGGVIPVSEKAKQQLRFEAKQARDHSAGKAQAPNFIEGFPDFFDGPA